MTLDYKALAVRIRQAIEDPESPHFEQRLIALSDLHTVASLLERVAEAQPIYAYEWDAYGGGVRRSFSQAPYNGREPKRTLILYAHPAPPPQPERQPVSEPTEAQIEARDALLDYIGENGTSSEGVQHYLDRYVCAALAAKETK